ncbi:MAG: hypothetical protein IPK26_31160 [Planctomycetes bacterium]|nr:hypothetical protein [Planctomycetota bacterium]
MRSSTPIRSAALVVAGLGSLAAQQPQPAAFSPATAIPTAGVPTARGLDNLVAATRLLGYLQFFHPTRAAVKLKKWDGFAIGLLAAAEPATDAADLARRLREYVAPLAPTVQLWTGTATDAPPLLPPPADATHLWSWRHHGAGRIAQAGSAYSSRVERKALETPLTPESQAANHIVVALGDEVHARIPFRVLVGPRASDVTSIVADWETVDDEPTPGADERKVRLAAVSLVWVVMEHFYPYFDVVAVDWPAVLRRTLVDAADDSDAREFGDTLRRMVASLQDGHGFVGPASGGSSLPLALTWAGNDLVVTGVTPAAADLAKVGDIVLAIDGKPVAEHYRDLTPIIGASTEGHRRSTATWLLQARAGGDPAQVELRDHAGATRTVTLAREASGPAEAWPARAKNGAEVAPGIVYFNLDRADDRALKEVLPILASAKGVIFDLRGYPGSAGVTVLRHLVVEASQSARWGIPVVTSPARADWQWEESGRWQLRPSEPHIGGQIAFLTDGQAVSYAESVMGIVEAYHLGEIVGATTAGTNGNVNPFEVPGGFTIWWTGMRVLKHDGSRHHGVGIAPTVAVEPTAGGIAAGKDEVLDKAIEVLQKKLGG